MLIQKLYIIYKFYVHNKPYIGNNKKFSLLGFVFIYTKVTTYKKNCKFDKFKKLF